MRSFTKVFLALLLCTLGILTTQAKTEKVHATFENPSNTNTTWNAETKTFTWSTTYYNQLRNIGLPSGDITKYKKLVIDCDIKSGDQFRVLIYKGGSNKTLYASNGLNEFVLADTLKALYPDDYNEFLLGCDEICLSGNNNVAPGEAVINDVYLETYDDEGEKVYATFENPSNTNTTWNAETKTFTWSTTYYNQLRNIGLPTGNITKYKKLVVDTEIKSGDQFRILFYKGGSNKTLYASNGVNEFVLADTLKALYPDDYNEFLLACDEICLSGNNNAAPGEAVINSVYLETYPENESVDIPEITYEEDPGKPEGEFVDFTEAFPSLQPKLGIGADSHPIVLGNGDVVVGQRSKDVIADLSEYSKLTIVTSPNLKLVLYMNHEIDARQNANEYTDEEAGKYVFLDVQANENGIAEVDLTQYTKQDLNCICLPWDNNNKGTVWYLLLTKKAAPATTEIVFDIAANPWEHPLGSGTGETAEAGNITEPISVEGVTLSFDKAGASTPARFWTGPQIRVYKDSKMIIAAPENKAVVKVVFTANGSNYGLAANPEGLVEQTWEGNATSVEFTPTKTNQLTKIVVTIADKDDNTIAPATIANTAETAYTVAKAFELIDAGKCLSDVVFVKGIVSKVDKFDETNKFINYWISDDGTTEGNQLEAYKGKGIDGADFASIDDVVVGAEVIITGTLTKYNETYEFNQGNALVSYKAPVQDSDLMKEAKELAADADAVAVGKLLAAIAAAEESGDESNLQAAIDQFKADNADVEKDETAKVATNGWKKYDGSNAGVCATQFAPAIDTYDGRKSVQLAEVYETTVETTGTIIYQDITGLTNGKYKVGFYGNAFYTSGRGFDSTMEDGSNDVAYVFANDQKEFITARIATSTSENNFRQFDVEVTDGTIKLGMGKEKPGTNWHTMQIYQLTWFTTAKAAYAVEQAELKALVAEGKTLLADENKKVGREVLEVFVNAADKVTNEEANMHNIAEVEAVIGNLKTCIADFKKANYFIDFAEGDYKIYVIDTESGKMMAAGHDWGTRGIVNEIGLDMTVEINRETRMVKFDTQILNGNKHYIGSDLYMDAAAAEWGLEFQGFGFYITNGTQYINIDANDNLVMSDTPREWIIVTAEGVMAQRLEEMSKATAENPVDATFLIQGANFNRNDARNNAWTVSADCTNKNLSGGNNVNNCAESYHSTFTISQVLKNAPKGVYKLTAQGFYRQDEGLEEAAPVFFIGDQSADIPVKTGEEGSMSAASESFTKGLYTIEAIEYVADADTMVIGVKNETATNQWIIWDNFQLTYYGPAKEEPVVAHTWDFTKWSEATVANLKADAAASKLEGWSDVEKKTDAEADADPTEASKDNCFWAVATPDENGELSANGVLIEELKGLAFNSTYSTARALAIAVNYPSTSLGDYEGPAYLWLGGGGKNVDCFVIKNVKAGTAIKMGVETHKIGDARGVQLFIEGAEGARGDMLVAPDGSEVAAPTVYTEQTWAVPGEDGVCNVIVYNTKGCHIYFIDAEIGEAPVPQPEIEKFYIMGTGTANAWDNTTEMPYNEETKAFEYTVEGADGVWIAFGDAAFTDWDDFNANHRYAIGAGDVNATLDEAMPLQKIEGTLVLAAGKYNVSVTKALICTITKVEEPEPEPVIADGVYDLTSDMFMKWESHEATEGQALGCNVVLNEPTGLPYGDGNVFWLNYANLSGYDKLVVTVEEGAPRFCFNRTEDNAQDNDDPETAKFIDIPGHSWGTQAYETVDESNHRFIIDLKKMTEERGFAHLHAIKGANWANVKVSALKLVKGDVDLPTSGISTVKFNLNQSGTIYNLNGQKMQKAQKGLYIINGKKVVIK